MMADYKCPCCGKDCVSLELVYALEKLREECGNQPIHILSGVRCEEWNETVGGVPRSQHLHGRAADIVVRCFHPVEVADKAERVSAFCHGGIGCYPHRGFVHVDIRKGPARWDG